MLVDLSLKDYIEEVDSSSPAPGGGSVANLVGTLGTCLAKMLANISLNKKAFMNASSKKQNKFALAMEQLNDSKDILKTGIDSDAISYQAVIDAYKEKDPEEIENALNASAFICLTMQEAAVNALKVLPDLIELGSKSVLSDLYSAAILLNSCVELSSLNIKANAILLNNKEGTSYYLTSSNENIELAKKYKNKTINNIKKVNENI